MKLGYIVMRKNGHVGTGEVIAIEGDRVRVQWSSHESWHDADELRVILDATEGFKLLREMFEEYHLDEYKPAFEAALSSYLDVCLQLREMRLHKEVKGDGKGSAA